MVKDLEGKVNFGVVDMERSGDYTIIRGYLFAENKDLVSSESKIEVTFLDDKGNQLGTASTRFGTERPKGMIDFAVLVGKGDFTKYKSVIVKVLE